MSTQPSIRVDDSALAGFYTQNPSFDVLHFDFHDQAAVSGLNWEKVDKETVLSQLKAYQRLLRIHPDPAVARALLGERPGPAISFGLEEAKAAPPKGLDSAHGIASMTENHFVKTFSPVLQDNAELARQVHRNASDIQAKTMHLWAAAHNSAASPHSKAMRSNPVSDDIVEHFEGLPGYQDMFGSLNYCECAHCKSIFGPAAYFVDLMRITDKYVTVPNADSIQRRMKLGSRRPDLAEIELTCENTNRTIPYLTIVNERLEETVRQALNNPEDVYQVLAQKHYPFELPFQFQLERIRIYLKRLQIKVPEIYAALEVADKHATAAESLGLSPEEWQLLTTKNTKKTKLQEYYGVSDLDQLSDAATFCKQTNLKLTQLHELLYQDLSAAEIENGLARQFFINQGLGAPLRTEIEAESTKIKDLNPTALDQLHRFLRLAAKLGWSYAELDWALHCVQNGVPVMDEKALVGIAGIKELAQELSTTVAVVCALLFDLKSYGVGEDVTKSHAPFDQVFNGPGVKTYHPKDAKTAPYALNPTYTDEIWEWTPGSDDETSRKQAARIASGLGMRQDDLVVLVEALFAKDKKKDTPISLTVGNLSALYRHAKLAAQFRLSVLRYVKLLELFGKTETKLVADDVRDIAKASKRLRRSGLNVFELDYVVTGTVTPFVNIFYREQDVDAWLKTLPTLVKSTAQDEEKKKKERKEKLVEQLATLAKSTAQDKEKKKKKKEQEEKLVEQLATFFGALAEQIKVLLSLLGQTDIVPIFLKKEGEQQDAKKIIQDLSRWLVLTKKLHLTNDEIGSIQKKPAVYGIKDIASLTAGNVLDIFRLKEFEMIYGDVSGDLISYVNAADDNVAAQKLSNLIGHDKEKQITQLLGIFTDSNQIERLDKIKRVFELTKKTGTDVSFLQSLKALAGQSAKDSWKKYKTVADTLLTAVRARLAADAWDQLYAQIEGDEQERKRTALVHTALNELAGKEGTKWIKNTRNLYEYLLIDVEMSGCAQISYIKEGLNALQLYLTRCRERLEPGIEHFDIPSVWWEWMINYRVWEANRKIFLYPENYIDPAHRKSKTQLFKDLESDLKQGDCNNETVEAAYKKYLDSFAELAQLQYVDAYYCNVKDETRDDAPTLFLFARTKTQPYKYYYLVQEYEGTWSEWHKIDVSIDSKYVTPIYAFNRLFVFWVELKKHDQDSSNEKNTVHKASIKYTFYNFSGKWVQPQTLVADAIISVKGSQYRTGHKQLFPGSLFDTDKLWWKKVYPLKIERERYWELGAGANKFEKIVIMYGPMIDTDNSSAVGEISSPTTNDATVREFEDHLCQTLKNLKRAQGYHYSGHLPMFQSIVINDDLQVGFLVNPDEFLFFQKESPKSATLFRPEIDQSASRLNLIQSNHAIHDNYVADQISTPTPITRPTPLNTKSFISTRAGIKAAGSATIYKQLVEYGYINQNGTVAGEIDFEELGKDLNDLLKGQPDQEKKVKHVRMIIGQATGTPWLSSAMRNQDYDLFTVKNHPAAFVFKGEKEAFLLRDPEKDTSAISRALFNSDTIFAPGSFVSSAVEIEQAGSQNIYQQLVNYGYLDQYGRLDMGVNLKDLRKDIADLLEGQPKKADKAAVVIDILLHRPLFQPDSFVSSLAKIEETGSKNIFKELVNYGYLDKSGRLDADIDFYELAKDVKDMLQEQPNQQKKVRHVVDTLYQSAFPSSVGFFESAERGCSIGEFKFEATRLTTAAVHKLSSTLFTGGIDALLSLSSQQIPVEPELPFDRFQFTDVRVKAPQAIDGAQVDFAGAYGPYYWELFFQAPLYITNMLKTNRQFQDAERWFHYIFNPTLAKDPIRKDSFQTSTLGIQDSRRIYTILKDRKIITETGWVNSTFTQKTRLERYFSFLNKTQIASVKNILLNHQLSRPVARFWQFQPFRNHTLEAFRDQLSNPREIAAYNKHPFDPHAIARLRIGAYEKTVIMKYIDNLLEWGDSLFTLYTWESLTTATMLYIYAYNLLGTRPENLGKCSTVEPKKFKDIRKQYKDKKFPQFLIALETETKSNADSPAIAGSPINEIDAYFCAPENVDFAAYWDKVEDRLYKIRHCMNIQGIEQSLALFQPPIDPAQLARAAAAGGDVLALVMQGRPEVPHYRFGYILERARNIAATLSQLGNALLTTLEKKDAEALALLRSTHEKNILNLTTLVKNKQIKEVKEQIAALKENQKSAQRRHSHYQTAYDENLNELEISDLQLRTIAIGLQAGAILVHGLTIAGYLSPNTFGLANGGMKFGDAINAGAQMLGGGSAIASQTAGIYGTMSQYKRRRTEWGLQRDVAQYDAEQIGKQILANDIRVALLERELEIHKKNIEQTNEHQDFLKSKFSNKDLYQWMIGRISTLYFQTYRMALDMAIAAQKVYQNELGSNDQFLEFDYWDSLHKGLLSGESLMLSLNQMEASYIENNGRDMEIEKTISLLHLDPPKFIAFKGGIKDAETGTLDFELSEKLFDFDFPGHYCRKIKSVSVTIPAVVGPYQNINATLVQKSNTVILKSEIETVKHVIDPKENPTYPDGTLRENWLPTRQIALSRGVDDSGLFTLNFSDERYLPFEGSGAVSKWTLHLPPETNRFNLNSISDVIVKIQYTAKDGGTPFADKVKRQLYSENPPYPYTPAKIFDLKQAFAGEWLEFISHPPQEGVQKISFPLTDAIILPNLKQVTLKSVAVLLQTSNSVQVSDKDKDTHFVSVKLGDKKTSVPISQNSGSVALSDSPVAGETCSLAFALDNTPNKLLADGALNSDVLAGVVVVITYQSNVFNKPAERE